MENPLFPVENLWNEWGQIVDNCVKEFSYVKGCGKVYTLSTGFPQVIIR